MILERFRHLRKEFLARTAADLKIMQALLHAAQHGDATSRQALRQHAHEICGSAGMLGLQALSDGASRIEQQLRLSAQDVSTDWQAIAAALAGLDTELNTVSDDNV